MWSEPEIQQERKSELKKTVTMEKEIASAATVVNQESKQGPNEVPETVPTMRSFKKSFLKAALDRPGPD